MNYKIVTDSGANLVSTQDITSVPITIMAGGKEYIDDDNLDIRQLTTELSQLSSKSSTACPNIGQWMQAFEGAQRIVAITITGALSGSYSAALKAREQYLETHPDTQILVLDSRSAGPRMYLLIEYAAQLLKTNCDLMTLTQKLTDYQQHTGLLFSLESLTNLVNNGRISPTVAKVSNLLKLRIVGTDTDGKLSPVGKARGQAKALTLIVNEMQAKKFNGKKACISHCFNEAGAQALKEKILALAPDCEISITETRGVCSYYAEVGGLLVGFETA